MGWPALLGIIKGRSNKPYTTLQGLLSHSKQDFVCGITTTPQWLPINI
jgi:hypothetical protein